MLKRWIIVYIVKKHWLLLKTEIMWKYLKFNICHHDINVLGRGLRSKETTLEAIVKVYMIYGDKLHQSSGSKYGEKYAGESVNRYRWLPHVQCVMRVESKGSIVYCLASNPVPSLTCCVTLANYFTSVHFSFLVCNNYTLRQ